MKVIARGFQRRRFRSKKREMSERFATIARTEDEVLEVMGVLENLGDETRAELRGWDEDDHTDRGLTPNQREWALIRVLERV